MSERISMRERLIRIATRGALVCIVAYLVVRFTAPSEYALAGAKAPAAGITTLEGTPLPLGEELGKKVVVLNFWATWCPPCRLELPEFSKLATEFPNDPVAFHAIAIDEEKDLIATAVKETEPPPPVAHDPGGVAQEAYQIYSYPTTLVIDRGGVIRYAYQGYGPELMDTLRGNIQELLK